MSNKSDYGLILVSAIAEKKEYISLSQLIAETKLPQRFAARIASELVREGILQSREGKVGGYKLARQLKEVTLFDFLKIFEKDIELTKCTDLEYACKYQNICKHSNLMKSKVTSLLKHELRKWSLADVIKV